MAENNNAKKKEVKEVKKNKTKKSFFKDLKAELKKVTWPTMKQVTHNTVGVIIIVIITAVIVFALDFTFQNFNEHVVNGLRTKMSEMSNEDSVSDGNVVLDNTVTIDGNTVDANETVDNSESQEDAENKDDKE